MKLAIITAVVLGTVSNVLAQYNLASMSPESRSLMCIKNTAFCLNACLQKVSSNICAPSTVQFSCICEDGTVPVDLHYFPIQAQQCIGENQDCRNDCASSGKTGNDLSICSNLCDQHFVCGTPNAAEKNIFQASPEVVQAAIDNGKSSTTTATTASMSTTKSDDSTTTTTTSVPMSSSVAAPTTTSSASSSTSHSVSRTASSTPTATTVSISGGESKFTLSRLNIVVILPIIVAIFIMYQ